MTHTMLWFIAGYMIGGSVGFMTFAIISMAKDD